MTVDLPLIVSVDDHVIEPPSVWVDRLPRRYRDVGPRVERDTCVTVQGRGGFEAASYTRGGDGPMTDWWVYEDLCKPIPQVMACVGFEPEELTNAPINYADMRPGCYDPKARLADMDLNHTQASLSFPSIPRFAGQMFLEASDKELALLCVRAYNDWMVDEWCGDSGGRLVPLCIVPLWDPGLAAEEVRRNAARGCRAVAFTELPSPLGLPSLHDPRRHWDPFFAACAETRTVVCLHIGSSSRVVTTSTDAPSAVGTAMLFTNAVASFIDLLLSGVLARFPDLKVAYSEGQIGWMPFVLERLDNIWRKHRGGDWAELDPSVTEPPSSYMPGRVFGCFIDDQFGLASRHVIGVDQITFETDYPHQESLWPRSIDKVAALAGEIPADELERIVRGNAIELFGLEL